MKTVSISIFILTLIVFAITSLSSEELHKNISQSEKLLSLFKNSKELPNIIILGKPGAGKSTLSKKLCRQYNYVHLSIGDIHRNECRSKTMIGLKIQKNGKNKDFFNEEMIQITRELLDKRFDEIYQNNQRFILDNFPTDLKYLPYMQEVIDRYQLKNRIILIVPEVTDITAKKRVFSRTICSNMSCNQVYSLDNKKFSSKKPGICNQCGYKLIQRLDDKGENWLNIEKLWKEKMFTYEKSILPVIKHLIKSKKVETFIILPSSTLFSNNNR